MLDGYKAVSIFHSQSGKVIKEVLFWSVLMRAVDVNAAHFVSQCVSMLSQEDIEIGDKGMRYLSGKIWFLGT